MRTTSGFDCVEMKRRAALKIHERLAGLSFEEQVEYWRKRSEEFRKKAASAEQPPADRQADPA